jgi:hypothetical protein
VQDDELLGTSEWVTVCAGLREGGWRPFLSDAWERHHELEYPESKLFLGTCQVCKANNVLVHKLPKDDFVAQYYGLTDESNLVCSECWVKAKVHDPKKDEFQIKFTYQKAFSRGGKHQETGRARRGGPKPFQEKAAIDSFQETRPHRPLPVSSKPNTMRNDPTIFVWDQYDILSRRQSMITKDGTAHEITREEWKTFQTPDGRLGSAWNCQLWTGWYHEFSKAVDLARYVRDRWEVDVEVIRNAGNAEVLVIALFDKWMFDTLCEAIREYSQEKMAR